MDGDAVMPLEEAKARAQAIVDGLAPELVALSHDIHAHPELSFQEHFAAAALADALERHGLLVERGAYGLETAFVAHAGDGDGPRVAICCEYDALPRIGHACGHNIIGTAGIGAGLALAQLTAETSGRVTILGTPAEEGGAGKVILGQRGAFEGVDAAMMVHPAGADVAIPNIIAVAHLEITMLGRAAHASAYPWKGINALDALVLGYMGVAALRQHIRETDRIHGIITHGGDAPNVVPERAQATFYVRAATETRLESLQERVLACFRAGAEATGARVEHRWVGATTSDLTTNLPLADAYRANAESLGRTFLDPRDIPVAVAGSTDMGNVSKWVPSIHPMIKVSPPHVATHSPDFTEWAASDDGDRAVIDGAKALAMTALDFWLRPELRHEVHATFRTGTAGR
jgi:amidohydrolase